MATDLIPYLNAIIISLGIVIGFVAATIIVIKEVVIQDPQGEILNTRFLLTALGTVILAMFGLAILILMILGIQVNQGYMTAFAGISGAFITIVGTSFNSYFKDRASEKSAYTHHDENSPGSGNSQEPSIDNGNPIRSFVLPKKMPLLQTK
jgi:hypothetical protein